MSEPFYTCISCRVSFETSQLQRSHYKSVWHRYNLKRKVVEMPPISYEDFTTRALALSSNPGELGDESPTKALFDQEKGASKSKSKDSISSQSDIYCQDCRKCYSSQNTFDNHLNSKRHKLAVAKAQIKAQKDDDDDDVTSEDEAMNKSEKEIPLMAKSKKTESEQYWIKRFQEAKNEQDVEAIMQEKMEKATKLDLEDCLFCDHRSDSLSDNLDHMCQVHSFFLPDLEFIVDLEGLVRYLGEKVSLHNVCLHCNLRGRQFYSIESVRRHMRDKGHCRINLDDEDEYGDWNITDYYDFSSTYTKAQEDNDHNSSDNVIKDKNEMDLDLELDDSSLPTKELFVTEDETELVLPNGTKIGNRAYSRYFKQGIRSTETRDCVIINRLMNQYKSLGYYSVGKDGALLHSSSLVAASHGVLDGTRGSVLAQRAARQGKARNSLALGVKANKFQKHYREQIL